LHELAVTHWINLQPSTFNLQPAQRLYSRRSSGRNDVAVAHRAVADDSLEQHADRVSRGNHPGRTPSLCPSNVIVYGSDSNNVNFYATNNLGYTPLVQSLPGGTQTRTYVLENFFILSSANVNGNPSWVGTGYVISTNLADGTLYPLYRFSMSTNVISGNPAQLFNSFYSDVVNNTFTNTFTTNWSHLMDGVVDLRVRAFDINGTWMNNIYTNVLNFKTNSTMWGETGFYMFSNTVPASVEVELGVLEDRTLQRAESLSGSYQAQTNYLAQHVGQVHIFRQRAWIRNVYPSAYK
jgi:hypothetical protein